MDNCCYIVGASPDLSKISILKKASDYLIAADGGYNKIVNKKDIDCVVGDFDSINELQGGINTVKYPVEKDETDLYLAYKEGEKRGYNSFVFYGCTGGRADHTIAAVSVLANASKTGKRAYIYSDTEIIFAMTNCFVDFKPAKNTRISVFSFSDISTGVCESGFKYTLNNAQVENTFPIGISNEFIGEKSKISVQNGTLILIIENTFHSFENFLKLFDF